MLGWPIARETPDHVLLAAASRIGMPAELLFRREADRVFFSTRLRHENPAAHAVWAGIERLHVQIVRMILEGAASRLESSA